MLSLNKNPSASKRVHFVNLIVILSTDSDTEEEDVSSTNTCDLNLDGMVKGKEWVKEQGKEENEMETDMEVDEVIEEEESEFETDEENPRPPWVKARIRARSPNNIKISCMVGQLFKRHAYIDLESPINIMSRLQYNQIITYGLRSSKKQKLSKPNEISNFVGRVKRIKVFIGSFAYECDFMILEDTSSIIDRHLGEMVFEKAFIDETGLAYDKEKGTVMFKKGDEKITFTMPYTMEIFKQAWLMGLSTDSITPSAHEENFGHRRTHYYQSLLIGDEYKQDGGDRRGIRHLMRLEKEMMDNKGEVTVLDLEKTKTTQHNEITSLKRRVKKLEKKNRSRTHKLKRLYKVGLTARVESSDNEESLGEDASKQGRNDAIEADEEIILVSVQNVDEQMFDVNVFVDPTSIDRIP
ncbi:hypothetical protein Tco_0601919 [Tanacetum coccineum]